MKIGLMTSSGHRGKPSFFCSLKYTATGPWVQPLQRSPFDWSSKQAIRTLVPGKKGEGQVAPGSQLCLIEPLDSSCLKITPWHTLLSCSTGRHSSKSHSFSEVLSKAWNPESQEKWSWVLIARQTSLLLNFTSSYTIHTLEKRCLVQSHVTFMGDFCPDQTIPALHIIDSQNFSRAFQTL